MVSDRETFGGAGVAAARLAEGLNEQGHEVIRIVEQVDRGVHSWTTLRWEEQLRPRHKLLTRVGRRPRALYERSAAGELDRMLADLAPEIINLHNLHSASGSGWSPLMLNSAARNAPVVWTLHDMWSFTGRCAYNYTCRKFLTGCDESCPTPFEDPVLDADKIFAAWSLRREMFGSIRNIHAVAPSRWLASEAAHGFWGPDRVSVIPYGIPLDIFRPIDRAEARAALGLPTDRFLLLVAAQDLHDRRKGVAPLETALGGVDQPLGIVTLGTGRSLETNPNVSVHELGFLDGDKQTMLAFNAADALVHPAIADNLPNVIIEALACGTPAVGFPVGGVVDLIRPGMTGWLADEVSAASLAQAITAAMSDIRTNPLRTSCRRVAEEEYSQQRQTSAYMDLFYDVVPSGG